MDYLSTSRKCSMCSRTEDLEACVACKKLVCPWHRAGLGSLSDGYACTETKECIPVAFGFPRAVSPPAPLKINRWSWERADTILVLTVVALLLLGIALGFAFPGRGKF